MVSETNKSGVPVYTSKPAWFDASKSGQDGFFISTGKDVLKCGFKDGILSCGDKLEESTFSYIDASGQYDCKMDGSSCSCAQTKKFVNNISYPGGYGALAVQAFLGTILGSVVTGLLGLIVYKSKSSLEDRVAEKIEKSARVYLNELAVFKKFALKIELSVLFSATRESLFDNLKKIKKMPEGVGVPTLQSAVIEMIGEKGGLELKGLLSPMLGKKDQKSLAEMVGDALIADAELFVKFAPEAAINPQPYFLYGRGGSRNPFNYIAKWNPGWSFNSADTQPAAEVEYMYFEDSPEVPDFFADVPFKSPVPEVTAKTLFGTIIDGASRYSETLINFLNDPLNPSNNQKMALNKIEFENDKKLDISGLSTVHLKNLEWNNEKILTLEEQARAKVGSGAFEALLDPASEGIVFDLSDKAAVATVTGEPATSPGTIKLTVDKPANNTGAVASAGGVAGSIDLPPGVAKTVKDAEEKGKEMENKGKKVEKP